MGGTADGLAEALDILCDTDLPEDTRRRALEETWWYIDRLRGLNYTVELKDAHGDIVSLDRETLPAKTIDSITFRSAHLITGRLITAALLQGDQARLNMLLSRYSPLGAATLILPVKEPPADEWATMQPSVSDPVPGDVRADEVSTEQPQPQGREVVRHRLRLILGEGQGRKQLTPEQRHALDEFLEGLDLLKEGIVRIESTLPSLLAVPEAVETLEQHLPGFKEAMARLHQDDR